MEAGVAHIRNSSTQEGMAGLHGKACLGYTISSRPPGAERTCLKGSNGDRDVPQFLHA